VITCGQEGRQLKKSPEHTLETQLEEKKTTGGTLSLGRSDWKRAKPGGIQNGKDTLSIKQNKTLSAKQTKSNKQTHKVKKKTLLNKNKTKKEISDLSIPHHRKKLTKTTGTKKREILRSDHLWGPQSL